MVEAQRQRSTERPRLHACARSAGCAHAAHRMLLPLAYGHAWQRERRDDGATGEQKYHNVVRSTAAAVQFKH